MEHPRFTKEEIVRTGQEMYDQHFRSLLETDENLGKVVVLDIENGTYEMDTDPLKASRRALEQHPGAAIYAVRVGYDAVYGFNGFGPQRVKQ